MHPTITLGSRPISLYAIMNGLAVVVLFIGVRLRVRSRPYSRSIHDTINAVFQALLGAAVGAWLVVKLPMWLSYLRGLYSSAELLHGGLNWIGAVAGGALAGYFYCRRYDLPPGKAFDLFAPVLPLSHAVGRVGCLLTGCCYGKETTAWPAMVLPDYWGVWASRYPTRIVSIAANLLICATLLLFERHATRRSRRGWPFDGFLFLAYVELYCLQRFFFEFWRADMLVLFGPFTWNHLYCAAGIVWATIAMVRGFRRSEATAG